MEIYIYRDIYSSAAREWTIKCVSKDT